MKSTDHNLNNPMSIDQINPSSFSSYDFKSVTKHQFDVIDKDPDTIYSVQMISGEPPVLFLGNIKIQVHQAKERPKYLISTSGHPNEYILYANFYVGPHDRLVEICRYDNPQSAIDELNKYNDIGSFDVMFVKFADSINSYISKDITLHVLISSIIAAAGFKDDPHFQDMVTRITELGSSVVGFKNFPAWFRNELPGFAKVDKNPLFILYSDLYDLVVKYGFFEDPSFIDGTVSRPLEPVLDDIHKIFVKYLSRD